MKETQLESDFHASDDVSSLPQRERQPKRSIFAPSDPTFFFFFTCRLICYSLSFFLKMFSLYTKHQRRFEVSTQYICIYKRLVATISLAAFFTNGQAKSNEYVVFFKDIFIFLSGHDVFTQLRLGALHDEMLFPLAAVEASSFFIYFYTKCDGVLCIEKRWPTHSWPNSSST